jgi:hypothetical protein
MKKLTIVYLLLLVYSGLGAQANKSSFYLSSDFNFGNYVGGNFNANLLFNEGLSLQIGYSGNTRKCPTQPSNYRVAKLVEILTLGHSRNTYNYFSGGQVLIGKIFWLNETNTTRLNLLGGLGFTQISEPTNWVWKGDIGISDVGSNYSYDINQYNQVSVVLNPKFEFTGKKFFGTSISLMLQANPKRTLFGIGFGTMIGDLR